MSERQHGDYPGGGKSLAGYLDILRVTLALTPLVPLAFARMCWERWTVKP